METQQPHTPAVPAHLRGLELLLFPLRTLLVLVPLWFVYWLFERYSANDVSGLHRFTIWLSAGLFLLSIVRTTMALRGEPNGHLLRGASSLSQRITAARAANAFNLLSDMFVRTNFSQQIPAGELRVLRRIELFALMPARFAAGAAIILIGELALPVLLANGTITSAAVILTWYITIALYIVYVVSQAVVAAVATGGPVFNDARKLVQIFKRFWK